MTARSAERTAFEVRPARPSDLARLDALFARAYPRLLKADYPPSILVTAVPLLARAQPRLLASGTYYVAETGEGRLVAAGGWSRRRDGRGEVRHVVTDDRLVRQGLGRAVLTRVLDAAALSGIDEMRCLSTRTAVPFYASLGFEEVGPVDMPLAPGITFPAVAMRRRM
ncbi:GNAT family N-acetyltransferase [Wenxinia marina]|uniref:Wenxma_13, whole genome shotgun sequence n=1 Tax=Wenxinia marina DSM 24838 TaxID=1123501 RepID=A0A0D0NJ25_9RHOB|nr:GNAT family N-acetyltransferase [Wenxinia marina]KIQ68340.1 Acetyltransferase, GNAT family [Wenxinia marina DSM 24838]GGL72958.1 N-acetyltransferase [Wenxinia marina]